MSVQTVTAKIGSTCHYWFTPVPKWDLAGQGLNVLDIVNGFVSEAVDQTPVTLTLSLDNSTTWNVRMEFRGAPPVVFDGLNVGTGGDLFTLLAAQGWIAL